MRKRLPDHHSDRCVTLRMPANLARQIEAIAKRKGISVNRLINEWMERLHPNPGG